MKRVPKGERPKMAPGYLESKVLPWSWAEDRLARSRNYWIATTTPAGTPHARPVWAVWLDGCLYFSSGSRIRRNLEKRPAVSINLESGDECLILEGTATLLQDLAVTRRVVEVYNQKYSWNMQAAAGEFFEAKPRVAFGWLVDGSGRDGGTLFSQTAVRWSFE
jgi:nitroimidazol reductase NimA-like FMN-containing flavoprotein (pyridoxamine 5'-phosphate oxidase superfamily)